MRPACLPASKKMQVGCRPPAAARPLPQAGVAGRQALANCC